MSCPPKCGKSPDDSGLGRSQVRRFGDIRTATPQMIRSSSPSPPRLLQSRPPERYESFQRASRSARAAPLSSTMYSDPGDQYPSMNMSQDISAISSSPRSQARSPQATYIGSPPRYRDASPTFQQINERPSSTIHSSIVTKSPGRESFSQEVKEIFDTSARRQPQFSGGNTTFDVAPIANPRQVSFNPPASSTIYDQSMSEMFDSSEMYDSSGVRESPYSTSGCRSRSPTGAGYTSDGTYNRSARCPRSTFVVPRQYRNISRASPKSLYDTRSPCSDPYDSSGSPYETPTYSEETSEMFDSSDEIDDSLLGKILRGEIGRNIQPMTPSDPKADATFTRPNATYSVTPMQSASSVECPCSDVDASLSFNPPVTSTAKKNIKSSIEDELTRREHQERVQLEQDLYRWQQARRRLVLDTSLSESPTY